MAHKYEILRTMFETKRKEAQLKNGLTPENLVVRTRGNLGHKLQNDRTDFGYNRSMAVVHIESEMLEAGEKVTSKLLLVATQRIAEENRKSNDNTLSA